jgi:hypothetical protein
MDHTSSKHFTLIINLFDILNTLRKVGGTQATEHQPSKCKPRNTNTHTHTHTHTLLRRAIINSSQI